MQRVQGDRQDNRPQHQLQKWLEHLKGKDHQGSHQAGFDQHIEQTPRQGAVQLDTRLHASPPNIQFVMCHGSVTRFRGCLYGAGVS